MSSVLAYSRLLEGAPQPLAGVSEDLGSSLEDRGDVATATTSAPTRPLGNDLLDTLISSSFPKSQLHLTVLKHGQPLQVIGHPVQHVYFPTAGFVTLFAGDGRGLQVAVAMVGRNGMVGTEGILDPKHIALTKAVVEVPGHAFRLSLENFASLLASDSKLRTMLLPYVHSLTHEFLRTAVSAAYGTLVQRIARWLLLAESCGGNSLLTVTHEHMAEILAVHRSGVTHTLHALEGMGAIKSHRGSVIIIDRQRLQDAANMPTMA